MEPNLVRDIVNVLIVGCVDQRNGILVQKRVRGRHNGWTKVVRADVEMVSSQRTIPVREATGRNALHQLRKSIKSMRERAETWRPVE